MSKSGTVASISPGKICHSFPNSECDVIFDKHRRQTLAVALFNLYYRLDSVLVKCVKWSIVPLILVHSFPPKQDSFAWLVAKHEQSTVEANLSQQALQETILETTFVISPSLVRSIGYDLKSVGLKGNVVPTISVKQHDPKPKQISNLMGKLNRKRVCMSNNRVIMWENYWRFTSSHICE